MHAVVFDIDGTLIQSVTTDEILFREAIFSVLGEVEFRSNWSDYEFATDSGILAQVLEDNSIESTPAQVQEIESVFLTSLRSHILAKGPFVEVAGARQLLEDLRSSKSHGVAIATGGWRISAVLKLNTAGFDLAGVPMATSNESPDRTEIMTIAASKLGDNFDSITYYGDGVWDRDACAKLGWHFSAVGKALGGITSYDGVRVV